MFGCKPKPQPQQEPPAPPRNPPVTMPAGVPPGGTGRRTRPFQVDEVRSLLAGLMERDREFLTARDPRGLPVTAWAPLQAVAQGDEALALLHRLAEPSPQESGTAEKMLELLMAQAEAIARIEERLVRLEGVLRPAVRALL